MSDKNVKGEGNPKADRRYREKVRDTVEETDEQERAEGARDMSKEQLDEARKAEERGRSRARD